MRNNTTRTNIDISSNAFDLISLIAALNVAFSHTLAHVLGGGMEQHSNSGFWWRRVSQWYSSLRFLAF